MQQAADLAVAAPTITASLDGRYMSALRPERLAAFKVFDKLGVKAPAPVPGIDKKQLVEDVRQVGVDMGLTSLGKLTHPLPCPAVLSHALAACLFAF